MNSAPVPTSEPTIPIVDLDRGDAADGLDDALARFGFVQLVGHHITADTALWPAMDRLFALPLETKLGWVCDEPLANRGYRRRGSEALAYSLGEDDLPPDLFESFNLRPPGRTAGNLSADPLMAEPLWPTEASDFVDAAGAYLDQMVALAARLDRLIGAIIGIPDLDHRSGNGPDAMACIRYQRGDDEHQPRHRQSRMGAHSDYTSFTILAADRVPGLEILTAEGWLGVVPAPGALLLNVGDLLAMWTNDAWPSTIHRVPLRGGGQDPPLRRSVAYFHYPDLDQDVAPLSHYVGSGQPTYRPTTVGDHLRAKLAGPKVGRRSTGATTLGARSIGQI